eukprot:TRINITY_DN18447_c0_g1_i1.p1 TRINITY_DN18447_c0_g1~~TRINITY_DN18447_c0_g1_i1.p1  ORF type:complete len:238 (+),score=56.42 TRINITY_DN18447_c0_g1_i1:86-799(+)
MVSGSSRRPRAGVLAVSGACAAVAAVHHLMTRQIGAAFLASPGPDSRSRREVLSVGASAVLSGLPTAAFADEAGSAAPAPAAKRVVGPKGEKPLYSFDQPASGFDDITTEVAAALANEGIMDGGGRISYERIKDRATVSAGPLPSKNYAKKWRNELAAPGGGIKVLKFTQSPTEDTLEFLAYPTNTDNEAVHRWARMLKGPNEGAMLLIEYPERSVEKDTDAVLSILNSFKLEERGQ